jgi:hypothetical protein
VTRRQSSRVQLGTGDAEGRRGSSLGGRAKEADRSGPSRGTEPRGMIRGGTTTRGSQAERVRSGDADPRVFDPRGPSGRKAMRGAKGVRSVGAESTHTYTHTLTSRQMSKTNKSQERVRKVRAVECWGGRALEMLRARTAGQHRARQAKECWNNQASGQFVVDDQL